MTHGDDFQTHVQELPGSHLHCANTSLQASSGAKGDDGKVVLVTDFSQSANLLHRLRKHHHIWGTTSRGAQTS